MCNFAVRKQPKNMHQNYIKYSQKPLQSSTGKERDSETGFSYFGARYYDSDLMTGWLSVDPMADKYPSLSPYAYCAWNPVRLVDPDGEAWKPTINENTGEYTGYEWIDPKDSYNNDGSLKNGLYEQAIFFSNNGNFDPESKFNIGSSTATVYLSDGSTKEFAACTNPSDASVYATVPSGIYTAKVGKHRNQYDALRLQGKIDLGMPNPSNPNVDYAIGINIHKPGLNNLTGTDSKNRPMSAGCFLIDRNRWDEFMNCFSPNNEISVSLSRSMNAPTNRNKQKFERPTYMLEPKFPSDNTRVCL